MIRSNEANAGGPLKYSTDIVVLDLEATCPDVGDNTLVTITIVEARIVNPLLAEAVVPDVGSSYTRNNAVTSAGAQAGATVETQSVTQSATAGVAPTVVPA